MAGENRGNAADLEGVRKELHDAGYILDDREYKQAVSHSRRKAELTGMGEGYIRYLLPDVIREMVVSREINNITASVLSGCRI